MKLDNLGLMNSFGGPLLKKSNAKGARPLAGRHHLHVVLKANRGFTSIQRKRTRRIVLGILRKFAARHRLRLSSLHCSARRIHFTLYLPRKTNFAPFIRAVTGALALHFSGASKKSPLREKFWACRPWTALAREWNHFIDEARRLKRGLLGHLNKIGMTEEGQGRLYATTLGP
jgi:hypothetical protein